MLVTISLYDSIKCGTLECAHMDSWNKYGDECDLRMQMYWCVVVDVLGGAAGIRPSSGQGQPTSGTNRWFPPSSFLMLNYEMLYHECYRVMLVQLPSSQRSKCWWTIE
jgi:hypothetical protein